MNNKVLICGLVVIVIVAGGLWLLNAQGRSPQTVGTVSTSSSGTTASTSGTTPPTPQPILSQKGVVRGQVLLGPTCPVERNPPDPACAPKPYQTTIRIQPANPSAPYTTISTDASGSFSVSLDAGTYTFQPQGGNPLPRCNEMQVEVSSGQSQTVNLDCDTGIR